MDASSLSENPFAVLTFIAAPAVLTNATVALASSAASRMLPTRRRMTHLVEKLEQGNLTQQSRAHLIEHANRVKTQAELLLRALYSIYLALGAFAIATLVTLLGAVLAAYRESLWFNALTGLAILLGVAGVGGLVLGSVRLFQATPGEPGVGPIRPQRCRRAELYPFRQTHLASPGKLRSSSSRRPRLRRFAMLKSAKRRYEREQFWRRLIREQERSGASIKAFCRSQGVSQPSYFAWRKKLTPGKRVNARPGFVAVQVVPKTVARSGSIEIMLDHGRRVRVESGFDRQLLSDVLAVLEEQPC
jgi:hypothetical protein